MTGLDNYGHQKLWGNQLSQIDTALNNALRFKNLIIRPIQRKNYITVGVICTMQYDIDECTRSFYEIN